MARPKLDPEIRAEVIKHLDAGVAPGEIARALKGIVSLRMITYIAKERRDSISARAARLAEKSAENAPADAAPLEDASTTTPEKLRKMIASLWRRADAAERAGNYTQATQLARSATDAMNTLLRAEQSETADADVFKISMREIDTAMFGVRERVRTILERPLLCAECSRALSKKKGEQ